MICSFIKPLAIIMSVVFALGWGSIGFALGREFGPVSAGVVLAIIGFIVGLCINLSGVE